LNAAGWCIKCLGRDCEKAQCIAWFAATVWQVCERCGGTEYVNGHRDPENSAGRCDCIQGFEEVDSLDAVRDSRTAQIMAAWDRFDALFDHDVPAVAPVVYESWPHAGGAPVRWAR